MAQAVSPSSQQSGHARSVPEQFEAVASRYADHIAISCRLGEITYGSLNQEADRVAGRLSERGDPGDRIAILIPHDRRLFAAMLGVLKAGRIVLILNGLDPEVRLRQLLDDAEPTVILTVAQNRELADTVSGPGIEVIDIEQTLAVPGANCPTVTIEPRDTAFIVYTSGSSGRPKGVMQTHGHTLRDSADVVGEFDIGPDDRVILLASLWGAQAVSTTFVALLSGARLVSFPVVEFGTGELASVLVSFQVTVFVAASSLFRHFVKTLEADDRYPLVRIVKLSADAANDEDLAAVGRHFPSASLINAMGCSECGHLTYARFRPGDTAEQVGPLPVGRPMPSVRIRIIDDEDQDRPAGVVGRIAATLPHLAAGYWRDPELTARHFFDEPDGSRTFRGGDAALFDVRGNMRLAGRIDATYKIRGQRVDLAEVERGVAAIGGVADVAAVAVARTHAEDLHLVAFVEPAPGWRLSPRTLRIAARGTMPRHHVPSLFVMVQDLPRTANGKVDRAWLRAHVPWPSNTKGDTPQTPTETLLSRLWGEALDLKEISRSDDFFDLGGDSLIATVISARLHGESGKVMDFAAFAEHPVLSDLAAFIDAGPVSLADEGPLKPVSRARPIPASPTQEAFLTHHPKWATRHMRAAVGYLTGPLDVSVLRRSLDALVERHEILRTRFVPAGDTTVQMIDPPGEVPLLMTEFEADSDKEAAVIERVKQAGDTLLDLANQPPVLFELARLAPDRHALIVASHHVAMDGPSWNIFMDEFSHYYEAFAAGSEPSLPDLPIQYADYAARECERWHPEGEALDRHAAWWSKQFAALRQSDHPRMLERYLRRTRVGDLDVDDWRLPFMIDGETSGQLEQLRLEEKSTYYIVRLAMAAPLIASATGHDTIAVGVYFTARTRPEVQGLFGPLTNPSILVLTCHPDMTFRQLVQRVHSKLLEQRPWADIPFSRLRSGLQARGIAVPATVFSVHMQTPVSEHRFAGLEMTWRDRVWYPMQKSIIISLREHEEHEEHEGSSLIFPARLYDTDLMRGFRDRLQAFARAAASAPDASIADLMERSGVTGGSDSGAAAAD